MNYEKIYNNIINKALYEDRKKGLGIYYENHHIIPRCLNGQDDKSNLVLLTAKEHFICHKLLSEIHAENSALKCAYFLMTLNTLENRNYRVSLREYNRIRLEWVNSKDWKNVSEETKNKISNTLKNFYSNKENHPRFNKEKSKQEIEKISNTLKEYYSDKNNRNLSGINHGTKLFNVYEVKDFEKSGKAFLSVTKGKLIGSYSSKCLASEELGISRSSINKCLDNKIKCSKNYIFEYEN